MSSIPAIKRKTNWKVALIFSTLLPAFNIVNNSQQRSTLDWHRIIVNWSITFAFLLVSWYANSALTVFFEKTKLKINFLRKLATIILCNAVLLSIFVLIGIYILHELSAVRNSIYGFIVLKGFVSIAMIYIVQYALNSDARAQEVSLQNQMLKTENIRAQFEILRQQVNPHFLFNSLSTLRSMIRSSNKNSELFVIKLSEIYRQLLVRREKEVVTLKEELDFVNDYSYMLFARFEKMLAINIDIPECMMQLKLPTFSLQLLLENCIKHNIISKEKPLTIKIFNTDGVSITVENNLQPKLSSGEHSGYGLQNLVQRYTLLGHPDGIFVFSDDTVFRVKIKLLKA